MDFWSCIFKRYDKLMTRILVATGRVAGGDELGCVLAATNRVLPLTVLNDICEEPPPSSIIASVQ